MLAGATALTLHFTAHELGVDVPAATDPIVANARLVAVWLEAARAELGGHPMLVPSGFRLPAQNAAVGGSDTSDHLEGLAADFELPGLTSYQVFSRLHAAQQAGRLPAFDQLIYYALDDHIHVGLGPRLRGEVLLKTAEGSYVLLAGAWLAKLRGYV